VAKIMHQSKFAIITPSGIAHEALFMQLPFIAIKVAENQDDMLRYLEKLNYPIMYDFEPQKLKTIVQAFLKGSLYENS
jgi:UDP-2,4-diacetamido-2,4,6-trideoxy-beta-L-altropyranose hydrolase